MSIEATIKEKVAKEFAPTHLELNNNSHNHSGPATESHFQLLMVSTMFEGQNRVQRQRSVYALLKDELAGPVHALSLRLLTPNEWSANKSEFKDPDCTKKTQKDRT